MNCRQNSLLTLPFAGQNASGVVVGFDIYPYSGATQNQTTFALFDSATQESALTFDLNTDGTLMVSSCNPTGCDVVFETSSTINWGELSTFEVFI